MDENNIHNDTDEYNRDIIKTMLSLMLFISFCPTFMSVCKYLLNDCKFNLDFYKLKSIKIKKDNILLLNECSICLEKYTVNDKIINLKCEHKYHKDCIKIWLKKNNTCPECRENII